MTTGYPDDWDRRRTRVLERDHYQCVACGATGGPRGETELHVDHVRPKAAGGGHGLENLQTLCRCCHDEKHGFEVGGGDETEAAEDLPVGLGGRVQAVCRTTVASAALGVTQLLAAWTLAVAPTTASPGIAATIVAGLLVVGVTLGVEWRPGRLPGFVVGAAVPIVLLYASDGLLLAETLPHPVGFADPALSGILRSTSSRPWR